MIVEVVWPTTEKETKRNTCKMNHVSSTAKEEEIFTRKIWWNHDVMEKKKIRYMDDDVTSRGRDVTKEDNKKAGYGKEENDAGNKEDNQWLSPILWIAIEMKTFELELEFKQKKTY